MSAFRKTFGRLLGLLLVGLLLGLAYLHVSGFPPFLIRLLTDELKAVGVAANFSSIRLELFRGVVARNARLADANDPRRTLVEIDEVQIHLNPRRLWEKKNMIDYLRIANAVIAVPLPADEQGQEYFTARDAFATFVFEDDGTVRIDRWMGEYLGIRLYVHGRFKPKSGPQAAPAKLLQDFQVVTRMVRELNQIRVTEAPELDIELDLDMARPLACRAQIRLKGDELVYRGLRVDQANVDLEMRNGAIEIRDFTARLYGGAVSVGGRYDFAQGRFSLQAKSTTDPTALRVLAPPPLREVLEEVRVRKNPTISVSYVLSPETGSLPQLAGTVLAQGLTVRGVDFRKIDLSFSSQGPLVTVPSALIVMREGKCTGQGQFHLESSDFAYQLDSTLDPTKLLPLMTPNIRRIVEPAWFETAPHIVASIVGDFVDPDNFAYDATIRAKRASYRGVGVNRAAGDLQLRRSRLDVRALDLQRSDGRTTGTLLADFNREQVTFDIATSSNPQEMAPLLGPRAATIMEPYHFGPRTAAVAKGLVDFREAGASAWSARVTNSGFSYWKLTAETASADLVHTNNTLAIQNFKADFYGGQLVGAAELSLHEDAPLTQFQFAVTDCDVDALLDSLQDNDQQAVSGRLSGTLTLSGVGVDLDAYRGEGTINIRDGILLQVPLFGIFTRILDDLSPGLGKAKATKARATFKVEEQAAKTEDLLLEMGVFTLTGRGEVGLGNGRIDFLAKAQILRQVPLLNIATAILGKILEYKVGGTLNDPSYRPTHLPKEILPHN